MALIALLLSGGSIFVSVWSAIYSARANRKLAAEAHEAENVPKISIRVQERAVFSDGKYLLEGENWRHQRPSAFEPPQLLLFVSVKNERKTPVKIKRLGIKIYDRFDDFIGNDLSEHPRFPLFPRLPYDLTGFDQIEFYVDPNEVGDILRSLFADVDSTYTVDAIDAIDRHYPSQPINAKKDMESSRRFSAALNVDLGIVATLGPEQYYPEGFVPANYDHKAEKQ